MRCDLAGLLINAASALRGLASSSDDPELYADYYAASLEDVAKHVHDVRAGSADISEFQDLYLLAKEVGPKA